MSYTNQTLVNDVYERLRAINPNVPPSIIPRLVIMVPDALRLLPVKVREVLGNAEAEIYRKNYTVALTAGQGALSSHTNLALASEPMLASEIVKVTHPDAITEYNAAGKLTRVGSESALSLPHSLEFAYYAVEDNILYTMMNDDRTVLGGNATVRAAYPPAIGNVREAHEILLVDILVERAGVKVAA
jgi:hypothetical protein